MIKRVTFLICYMFLLWSTSISQSWIRIYESVEHAIGRQCNERYDNGFLIIGYVHIDNPAYVAYGLIQKTDINGYELWRKTIKDSAGNTSLSGYRNTSDGGLITIGSTALLDPYRDPLVVKFNSCGEKEWCRIFNSPDNFDYGVDIETISGGYIGLMKYWWYDKSKRIWLFKLDEEGDLIWQQAYTLDTLFVNEEARSLYKTANSSLIITGYTYWPDTIPQNYYFLTPLLIKVNENGSPLWELPWGANNKFVGRGIMSTCDLQGKIFTGSHNSLQIPPYGDAPCLLRTSAFGDPIDYINLKDTSFLGFASTINWFEDSTLVIGATWQDQAPGSPAIIGAKKVDTLGNILMTKDLLTISSEWINDATVTEDNKVFLISNFFDVNLWKWQVYAFKLNSNLEYDSNYTTPFTYDSLCPYPIVSDTIPLDDCEVIVDIDDPVDYPEKTRLHVFPNPAQENIAVEMPEYLVRKSEGDRISTTTYYHQWSRVQLEVFDLFGRLMYTELIPQHEKTVVLDISTWPGGMYVARVVFMNEVVGSVKFVVEDL